MATAYLDTCIISALVKTDIDAFEQRALDDLFARYERGDVDVKFVCSDAVESELARIPAEYRGPHLEKLALFRSMPRVSSEDVRASVRWGRLPSIRGIVCGED